MKISLFNKFGALNSVPVFAAFQQGLDCLNLNYDYHNTSADVAVIWSMLWTGRMQKNQSVWQEFRRTGRPVVVIEVGMLDRGRTWKMGINGTGHGCYPVTDLDPNRPKKLGIELQPWRDAGEHILIAMQRSDSEQWAGQPAADKWLVDTVDCVRQYSDRPIVVRTHPRQSTSIPAGCQLSRPSRVAGSYDDYDFFSDLRNAWAVVNHNSGPGSQAIVAGVPAFVDVTSLALPVGNTSLSQIETPRRTDRTQWITELCHTEWTVDEIASGRPIERLLVGLAQ
jgi:hypothetical protein